MIFGVIKQSQGLWDFGRGHGVEEKKEPQKGLDGSFTSQFSPNEAASALLDFPVFARPLINVLFFTKLQLQFCVGLKEDKE